MVSNRDPSSHGDDSSGDRFQNLFPAQEIFQGNCISLRFPGKYDSTNPLKYGFYNNGNSCWNREIFHRNLLWWWLPQNNWQSWIELPPCLPAWSTMCKVIIPRGAPINKEDKWKTDINQKQVKQAQISKTWNGKRSFLVGQKHAKLVRGDKNDSDYRVIQQDCHK